MDPSAASLDALRDDVRAFLADELDRGRFVPRPDSWLNGFSRDFSQRLAARGWVGMTIPREFGGAGRTVLDRFVVAEECLAAGAPVTAHWTAERQVAPMLMRVGTDEQQARVLPGIAAGRLSFGVGLSEPDAGSDLAALRTTAVPTDGGWRLNGQKVWTTSGHLVQHTIVLCRTGGHDERHRGLSQLMIDMAAPGVTVRPITTMSGDADFCEVHLDDVFVPHADVIGTIGQGWSQATQELGWERTGPDRYLSTFVLTRELARRRDPADDEAVGELLARTAALRGLSQRVMAKGQSGIDFGTDAALSKDAGTVFEQESVEIVRRSGAAADPDLRDLLRTAQYSAPTFTLRGGTNEILRTITAKGLLST